VINFAGGELNIWKGQSKHIGEFEIDKGQYNDIKEVDFVEGSCLLLSMGLIKKIGLMDPSYFNYWEENDWCIRGYMAGYKSVYVPKSKIWHKLSGSSTNQGKIYYFTRNQFFFMKKNAYPRQMITFLLYFFGFYFWFKLWSFIINNRDIEVSKCFLKGVRDGIKI